MEGRVWRVWSIDGCGHVEVSGWVYYSMYLSLECSEDPGADW